jgi:hypothetical protein
MGAVLTPTVIRFGRVGDMIMLTALTAALHHRYGAPCQVIGAGVWNRAIFKAQYDVGDGWSFARHVPFALSLTWPRVVTGLHRSRGPVYVCEPHERQLPRVRRLLKSALVSPSRCLFITELPIQSTEHCVARLLRFSELTPPALAGRTGAAAANQRWSPHLEVVDEERAWREVWLRTRGWSGRELVLVQAGNFRSMSGNHATAERHKADDKAWPVAHWKQLFAMIHQHNPDALVVLCGANAEIPVLHAMRAAMGLDCVVVADLSLRQLFAVCEAAHSMISVDTGPAHAAAALGLPLVVMYGAESPAYWLPRGPEGTQVIGLGGPPASHRVDQISVGDVFDAWRSLESRGAGESASAGGAGVRPDAMRALQPAAARKVRSSWSPIIRQPKS